MGCLPIPSDFKRKRRFLTLIKHDDSDAHEKADFSEAKVDEPEITPHTQDSGFQESESVCDVSVVSLSSFSDEDEEEEVGDKLTCSLCDQVFGSAELLSQHGIVHEANNTTSPFVSNIEDSIYDKILAEEADHDVSEVTEPSSGLSDSLLEDYDSLVDSLISSVSPDELLQKISITDEFPDNYADDRMEEEQQEDAKEEGKSTSNCDISSQTSSSDNDSSAIQIIPISKKAKIIPRSKTKKSSVISTPSYEDLSLKSQLELSSDEEKDPSSHGASKVTIPIRKKEKKMSKSNGSKRRKSNWSSTPSIKDLASNMSQISEDEEERDNISKKPKLDEISKEDIEFENMVNQKVFKILSQKNATYSKDKSIFIGEEKTHIQLQLPGSPSVRHCDSQPEEETNLLHAGHLKVRQPSRRRLKRFMNTQQHIDDVYSGIREEAATCDKTRRRLDRTTARWKRGSLKHQLGLELKSIPYSRRRYGSGLLEACGLAEEEEEEKEQEQDADINVQSVYEELNGSEQRVESTEHSTECNRLSNLTLDPSHGMNKPDVSLYIEDPEKMEDVGSYPPSNTSIADSLEPHETTDDENIDNESESKVQDKVATEISHDLSMPVFEF